MKQDESRIYPTSKDIYGGTVSYEQISKAIEEAKNRFISAKDRISDLQEKVYALTQKWGDDLINGVPDEELRKTEEEITRLEKQIELLGGMDTDKEKAENLRKDKNLSASCKAFEDQQRKVLETLLTEEEKLAQSLNTAFSALVDAIKAWRAKRQVIANICTEIGQVHRYIDGAAPVPPSYEEYKAQMANINVVSMANKIRMSGGIQPASD